MHSLLQESNKVDSLAQQAEHIPFKDGVLGSNPRRITKKNKNRLFSRFFCFLSYFFRILFRRAFPTETEQNVTFHWKTGPVCTKILSFLGKRALTLTNSIPPSDFSDRNKENSILFLKIRRTRNRVFRVKTAWACRKITVIY